MIFTDGTWSDLTTLSDGRVVCGYSTPGGLLRAFTPNGVLYGERNLAKWLLYLRVSGSTSGHFLAIGQDQATGAALFSVDFGQTSSLGPCHGVWPVECIPDGDGWKVYVFRPGRYEIYRINQFGTHELLDSVQSGSSQGFLQCDGGIVRLSDDHRSSVPGLYLPTTSNGYALGQNGGADPARLRVSDSEGRLAAVYTGLAQPPRILVKDGFFYGTSFTAQGTWLEQIALSDIPWGNDATPAIPPDVEWQTDLTRTINDVLDYLEPAATARVNHEDNKFTLWLRKSQERPDWGEWWYGDNDYVGLLEDRSTGLRLVSLPDGLHPMSPEEILERNENGEDLGDPLTLPLASYTWTPGSLWMPRRFTGKWGPKFYRTAYSWYKWETWGDLQIGITAEAGYGRYAGHDVFLRHTYKRPAGYEVNYFGPTGWRVWESWSDANILEARSVTGFENKGWGTGPYVESRYTRHYPIIPVEAPKPPSGEMTTSEAKSRAGYPAPSDIVDGAINVFQQNLLPRDVVGDSMTEGAWRYFGQYYYPKMAEQQIEFGIPGTAEGWGHYSLQAVNYAKAIYDRDQKGTLPPSPPTGGNQITGLLKREGKVLVDAKGAQFQPCFTGCLYGLAEGRQAGSRELLSQAVQLGFNGLRVFAGHLEGRNQTPESARSRLPDLLRSALDVGMYVQVCAITDSAQGYDVEGHLAGVGRICNGFPNTILEIANEIGHPTQARLDLPRLESIARSVYSGVIIWGADVSTDELVNGDYPQSGGDCISSHLLRNVSPGGTPMPWYHEASRLTELLKIRDRHGKPVISGEPNRVEVKDNPVGFAFLLGGIAGGLGLGTVFHSSQARDAEKLSGIQLDAAKAFVLGYQKLSRQHLLGFINGHWAEAPVEDVKWYDPPRGAQAWRVFTFVDGNNANMLITGSPDPANWRNAFSNYKNGWSPDTGIADIPYGCPIIALHR
jgi:hypothetical protein